MISRRILHLLLVAFSFEGAICTFIALKDVLKEAKLCSHTTAAFGCRPTFHFRRHMISDLFGSGSGKGEDAKTKSVPLLPRDVKEAVAKCREATQAALRDRVSRMVVEFPVGTKFGVENSGSMKKRAENGIASIAREDLDTSNRELARIFVEMFQPVGGDNLVVAFTTAESADMAKKLWSADLTAAARVISMDRRKSYKTKVAKKGFAAKIAAEIDDNALGPFVLPQNTEVVLFVAPGPKELVVIERVCEKAGMGTLVILLNARLSSLDSFGSPAADSLFRHSFVRVFILEAAPQDAAPGCLLYAAYKKSWVLARKSTSIGQPQTILVNDVRPTNNDCRQAYEVLTQTDGELKYMVENAIVNVANWFR